MHAGQLELGTELAARLIIGLLPQISERDVQRLDTAATTSHVFRVGHDLIARFPMERADPEAAQSALAAEHRAMAEFARHCQVASPKPFAIGPQSPDYPMPWSVQTWVPGVTLRPDTLEDSAEFAVDLADLVMEMRSISRRDRRFQGSGRGGSLTDHDTWIQLCLERSGVLLPVPRLAELWSRWRILERTQPDVMSHRDLIPANLLVDGTRLVGVLDTGSFSPADPALDLVVAWHALDAPRRKLLRDHLECSDLEWERGAAWAFAQAIGLVWYYETSNPMMAELGRSTLQRLLDDYNAT